MSNRSWRWAMARSWTAGDSPWASLATGEFLLGHPDEAQETAGTTQPPEIMRNGTFLVYRKLHENVASFDAYHRQDGAKLCGEHMSRWMMRAISSRPRWRGAGPMACRYRWRRPSRSGRRSTPTGRRGPQTRQPWWISNMATIPKAPNAPSPPIPAAPTRATAWWRGKSSALNNRRRILRRGIPYGRSAAPEERDDRNMASSSWRCAAA